MATSSEIKVTQAYIGLFGRAPDPDGLAYWAAQLDAEVAAGKNADVALKELTAGMTANTEWTVDGLGATGTTNTTVINTMYTNLFGRSPSAAEREYWLDSMEENGTTASEMVVQLVQGAGDVDAEVLDYKQEAATYYAESVDQDAFDRTNAGSAVSSVDGPRSLESSKEATDVLASGVGNTIVIGTDTVTMTLGNDTVTGEVATGKYAATTVADASTSDSDSLSLTATGSFAWGTTTNVEAVDVSLSKITGSAFTLSDTQKVTGDTTLTITTAETVDVSGAEVSGETDVILTGGLSVDVNTVNATSLTATMATGTSEADVAISGDSDLATVTLSSIADSATSVTLANNDTTVTIDGTTATNDAASIHAVGDVALDVDGAAAQLVEKVTLEGTTGAVDFAVQGATGSSMTYTTTGSNNITLSGTAAQFSGSTITQSGTGDVGIDVTTTMGDLSVWGAGLLEGGITVSADAGGAGDDTFTIVSGSTVNIAEDQNAAARLVLDANDATAGSSITINANENAGELETEDFESIVINTNDSQAVTIDEIDMDANDANVVIAGANDVTFTGAVAAGQLEVSANEITFGSTIDADPTTNTNPGAVTLTATGGALDVSADKITSQNDITLTAEGAITADDMDATVGRVIVNGDSFNAAALVDGAKGVEITATNDVDLDGVAAATGNITISGKTIDNATTAITATAGNVTLTASSHTASNIDAAITASGTIALTDGTFDATGVALTAESVTITGDTGFSAGEIVAESVVITSSNDVSISTMDEATAGDGFVIAGGSATGSITLVTDAAATTAGTATIFTGSGNDTLTLDDTDTTFVVETGGNTSTETINLDNFATGSSVDSGDGDDVIDIDETTAGVLTLSTGAGDDTVNLADSAVTGTFDLGTGTDDKVVLQETGGVTYTALGLKNIEELDISAGDATFTWSDLSGNDTSFMLTGDGADTLIITGGTTAETIDLTGITANAFGTADLEANAGAGNDTVTGSETLVNVIDGEGGFDTIVGGNGDDTLSGGADNDTITGGKGADTIDGEAGDDSIILTESTSSQDLVSFGAGHDTITGYSVGAGATDDHLIAVVADVEGSAAGTDLVNMVGTSLSATDAVVTQTIAGATDLETSTANILLINDDIASASALEDALEIGGDLELTAGSSGGNGAIAAGDCFLVIFDDGTNTYIAVVTSTAGADDTTFAVGDLDAEIIATISGVSDASSFADGDFGAFG